MALGGWRWSVPGENRAAPAGAPLAKAAMPPYMTGHRPRHLREGRRGRLCCSRGWKTNVRIDGGDPDSRGPGRVRNPGRARDRARHRQSDVRADRRLALQAGAAGFGAALGPHAGAADPPRSAVLDLLGRGPHHADRQPVGLRAVLARHHPRRRRHLPAGQGDHGNPPLGGGRRRGGRQAHLPVVRGRDRPDRDSRHRVLAGLRSSPRSAWRTASPSWWRRSWWR